MADYSAPAPRAWKQNDPIASESGTAFLTVGRQNIVLFYAKSIEAKITKNKNEVRVSGRRAVGHKATSWGGSGTLKIYEITSAFKEMFLDYVNGGEDVYFEMQVVNEDPLFGREVKQITGCNFDEIVFAQFSSEDGFLEQELPFTFDGVELLEKYKDAQ